MLKHGRVYPGKKSWTTRYLQRLHEQGFDHPAHKIALQEMVEAVCTSKARVERLENVISEFVYQPTEHICYQQPAAKGQTFPGALNHMLGGCRAALLAPRMEVSGAPKSRVRAAS
jgi:hypothetical protein